MKFQIIAAILLAVFSSVSSAEPIFSTFNQDATLSNPPISPVFEITNRTFISDITNYHFNNGNGSNAEAKNGTIGLWRVVDNVDAELVGSWQAVSEYYNGRPIFWKTTPNIFLEPGTYKVADSDHVTWSYTNTRHFDYLGFAGKDWKAGVGFTYILGFGQNQVPVVPRGGFIHNSSDGLLAIKDFKISYGNQCSFTFSTANPGGVCIVSSTTNFSRWLPFVHFNATTQGTKIFEKIDDPSKFYRAIYLPAGVAAADSFDYPIGTGHVPEQIAPEQNNLYPDSPIDKPYRGASSPSAGWHNIQDVGSYYEDFGGIHAGEDWNKGSGSADVGEPIKAVANGQVMDIRPAGASGVPSTSGYAMIIRHWLLNGESVDSLYVHLAPDQHNGGYNGSGILGDKSAFTYQVGDPVAKGSVVGVIGAVSAFPPHLHFEMRNKPINVSGALWPLSTGNAYYGAEVGISGRRSPTINQSEVEAAFKLMQKEGIIDPSDFIDNNR